MTRRTTSGFTLLECIMVAGMIGVLASMGLKIFFAAQQLQSASALAHERLELSRNFEEAVRETLRRGSGPIGHAGNYNAGPTCAVVRLPMEEGAPRRAVISIAPETKQPFIATLRLEHGAWRPERFQSFALPLSMLEFHQEDGLVQCRYDIASQEGERKHLPAPHVLWVNLRGMSTGAGK